MLYTKLLKRLSMQNGLYLLLDIPVEISMQRAAARRGAGTPDRFESEDVKFHQKLREAYRQIAADEPQRCVLIDANADPGTVASHIWAALRERFFPAAANVASSA